MKKKSWDIPVILIYVVVVLVFVNGFLIQPAIDKTRTDARHAESRLELTPMEFIDSGLIGGFRAFTINHHWTQLTRVEFEHQYYDIEEHARRITRLAPNFPDVWIFTAWALAYNVSVDWRAREQRWEWIRAGIDILKEGIRKNGSNAELEFELGWLYFHKVSDENGDADYYWMMEQVKKEEGLRLVEQGKPEDQAALEAAEALELAAEHFNRAKNAGTHPRTSHRTIETQELFALQQLAKYLLIDKPHTPDQKRQVDVDVERGFDALARSVDLAEEMILKYPDYEGFSNRMKAYGGDTIPRIMEKFPADEYPEQTTLLEDALARIIVVVQQYNPEWFYIDIE